MSSPIDALVERMVRGMARLVSRRSFLGNMGALLFACSLESNRLEIYDASYGKYLRTVEPLGQTPTLLVLP